VKFKPEIKSLIVVHTAMLLGQLLFAVIVYVISNFITSKDNRTVFQALQIFAIVLSFGCGIAAFKISKQRIQQLQLTTLSFSEKFTQYRSACILKYALLEIPAMFCLVSYFIIHNISFLLLFGVLLFVFAGQKPTVFLMTIEMNVSKEELMQE
jgi:hypothetical protein